MDKGNSILLLVADDDYQLPLCTGESIRDLAKETGLSYKTIHRALHSQCSIRLPKGRFTAGRGLVIRVNIGEE